MWLEPWMLNWRFANFPSSRVGATISASSVPQMEEVLGIAYLHKSEMENAAYQNPGERFLFPPHTSWTYQHPADSKTAIQYFAKYLEKQAQPARSQVAAQSHLYYVRRLSSLSSWKISDSSIHFRVSGKRIPV
jgi:hypothetical protein